MREVALRVNERQKALEARPLLSWLSGNELTPAVTMTRGHISYISYISYIVRVGRQHTGLRCAAITTNRLRIKN